ncbi:hypothetical protein [Dyella silvatica]|uniref:hypothetical protein n=1 Tax=Dyella silvatica TaxID=2992128 RepID=UPI00224F70A5|nr:hypothetical protein [Dyella silvatica]
MWLKYALFLLVMVLPSITYAQSSAKYFGYFYNDGTSYNSSATGFSENYNRINLYHIDLWAGNTTANGREATILHTLSELEQARSNGVKAIITATPFVFQFVSGSQWTSEPNASAVWGSFVDRLVSAGYLVPGNSQLSTIAAIYLIDEPENSGFYDQNGVADPAMVNAVKAIRGNSSTTNVPIAMVMTPDFASMRSSIGLVDWVGFDHYEASTDVWTTEYNQLKAMLLPNQYTILVPKAAQGGACQVGGGATTYDDPWRFYSLMQTDPKTVWLSPFRWFSPAANCLGVRDIPSLATSYNQIGLNFKQATNPVAGKIDSVNGPFIKGWACTTGVQQPAKIDLYVGGPYGGGGTFIGEYLANIASGSSVAAACSVPAGGAYAFQILLPPSVRHQYGGKKIFVYGVASYGGDSQSLANSGSFAVPYPSVSSVVDFLLKN